MLPILIFTLTIIDAQQIVVETLFEEGSLNCKNLKDELPGCMAALATISEKDGDICGTTGTDFPTNRQIVGGNINFLEGSCF